MATTIKLNKIGDYQMITKNFSLCNTAFTSAKVKVSIGTTETEVTLKLEANNHVVCVIPEQISNVISGLGFSTDWTDLKADFIDFIQNREQREKEAKEAKRRAEYINSPMHGYIETLKAIAAKDVVIRPSMTLEYFLQNTYNREFDIIVEYKGVSGFIKNNNKIYKSGSWHAEKTDRCWIANFNYKNVRYSTLDKAYKALITKISEKIAADEAKSKAEIEKKLKLHSTLELLKSTFPEFESKSEEKWYSYGHGSHATGRSYTEYTINKLVISVNNQPESEVTFNCFGFNNLTAEEVKQIMKIGLKK